VLQRLGRRAYDDDTADGPAVRGAREHTAAWPALTRGASALGQGHVVARVARAALGLVRCGCGRQGQPAAAGDARRAGRATSRRAGALP
jgi:hypothetical protein